MEAVCKNCDIQLQPDYDYCPKCSQKTKLHRLSLHDVFHEAVHYFTHADKGLFQLIRDLVVKRGIVARQFVEGKRKRHFPPLNFFLLVAALNFFAINVNETYRKPDFLKEHPEILQMKNPAQQQAFLKLYERQSEAIFFIKSHSNATVVVILPIMAFVFWLFYRKKQYNFTEHLIAGMYMYGFCTLVFVILALANLLLGVDDMVIYCFCLMLQVVYFSNFYYRFMGNNYKLRAFFASISAVVSVFVFTGVIVALYMFGIF